jgi:sugar/nucleoside kinase (ribokinase family)
VNSGSEFVSIGHAIIDVLGHADDAFLGEFSLVKGSMELIEGDRAVPLYEAMAASANKQNESLLTQSGGSAANTAVVAAMLGTPTTFVGKVCDDALGHSYAADLHHVGVRFETAKGEVGSTPTGRSLINVTPDAERTMATYLGAARTIRVPDIDMDLFTHAKVTYVEGYLWDELNAHEALELAIRYVKEGGQRFSFTLSDPFLVDRFRDEFLEMIPAKVDILFANEHELMSLFQTDDFDRAVNLIRPMCEFTTITRGKAGSIVIHGDEVVSAEAYPVPKVIDTTGAGDAYAGGFLAGFCQELPLKRCAELGNIAAGEVISRLGARPTDQLKVLAG